MGQRKETIHADEAPLFTGSKNAMVFFLSIGNVLTDYLQKGDTINEEYNTTY